MGGGDLNLKKSWHPNTMKNMERVWKAEQKDTEEKKRIAELQREIIAERSKEDMQKYGEETGALKKKDDIKLEWMYKGPNQTASNEDYLLGKAVDKSFEQSQLEQSNIPSTSFGGYKDCISDLQVDMARKVVEDPLEMIRRRAIEKAKELYNNPVKMKKIQKMAALQSQTKKNKHKKEKKEKKKKKSSKFYKKIGDDSDNERDLDAVLTAKLKKVLKNKDVLKKLQEEIDSSDSDSNNETDLSISPPKKNVDSKEEKHYKMSRQTSTLHSRKRSRSRSPNYSGRTSKKGSDESQFRKGETSSISHHNRSHSSAEKEKKRGRRSYSSEKEVETHRDNLKEDATHKKTFGLMMPDGSIPVVKHHLHTKEHKPRVEATKPATWEKKERVKMTEKEMERRRREMMDNASWRDREREAAVKQYRLEEAKEKNQHERDFDKNFAMKQFSKATDEASIEGRIKSKLNNIQRSKISMDKNFARR